MNQFNLKIVESSSLLYRVPQIIKKYDRYIISLQHSVILFLEDYFPILTNWFTVTPYPIT